MNIWEWISNYNNLASLTLAIVTISGFIYWCYARLYSIAKSIHLQLVPNGGSSIKDQLNRLESFFKASLRMNGKLFWIFDKNGKCIDISEELCVILGKSPNQLYGDGWLNTIDLADFDRILEHWTLAVDKKIEFDDEYTINTSNKKQIRVRSHRIPMFVNKGNDFELIGYLGWIDILNT